MQTLYPVPATNTERSLATPEITSVTHGTRGEAARTLDQAIASCATFIETAESGMINGSIPAVRAAFTQAEQAFERTQECLADLGPDAVPAATADTVADLAVRLDALWVRLICAFS